MCHLRVLLPTRHNNEIYKQNVSVFEDVLNLVRIIDYSGLKCLPSFGDSMVRS